MIRLSKLFWPGMSREEAIKKTSNGIIEVYSGCQPETGDDEPTGTLLGVVIAKNKIKKTPDIPEGLEFKNGGIHPRQAWKMIVLREGTAGWFRYRKKTERVGIDGAIGHFCSNLQLTNCKLMPNYNVEIASFSL